jgi:hypothetical protein
MPHLRESTGHPYHGGNTHGRDTTTTKEGASVEPGQIFKLILKADDALKYATEEKAASRASQARGFLVQARDEARAIGNEDLVRQAEVRLADLESLLAGRRSGIQENGAG